MAAYRPSVDEFSLPLPSATRDAILSRGRRPADSDNLGLWLDKLALRRAQDWSLDKEYRSWGLRDQFCRKWTSPAGKDALARQQDSFRRFHPEAGNRCCIQAKTDGRLLVDYGKANAIETTVIIHRQWGVPRIPGSALKGATLSALRQEPGISQEQVETLFGTQKRRGVLVFYDALPLDGKFELSLDVLTPHCPDYYRGDAPPGDWQSPIPHTFLTVVNTTFVFLVGLEPFAGDLGARDALMALAKRGLGLVLEETGVGAKTSAGYGRFAQI